MSLNPHLAPAAAPRTAPLPSQARTPLSTGRPPPSSTATQRPLQPTQFRLTMPPRPGAPGPSRPPPTAAAIASPPRPTVPPIQTNRGAARQARGTSPPPAPPFSPIARPAPLSREEGRRIASLLGSMDPYSRPGVMAARPHAAPIAESENTDVIALRAALSVLQMQRQTARRDIGSLHEMRREALEDPEGYVRALVERVNAQGAGPGEEGVLDETLRFAVQGLWEKGAKGAGVGDVGEAVGAAQGTGDVRMAGTGDGGEGDSSSGGESSSDSEVDEKTGKKKKFGKPPKPQKVFRMPPINWSKYQVAGEALDRLHEAERRRPSPGSPFVEIDADDEMGSSTPEEPYVMAAPYQPFKDQGRLLQKPGNPDGMSSNVGPSGDHPMKTRRAARRHAGSGS